MRTASGERRLEVLRAIVEDFIATNEPVGSKALVDRHRLGVSSATIRNDMAALEEEGLIVAPHTSAGRVPTDLGYRVFVDRLADLKPMSGAERRAIAAFLEEATDLDDVVQRGITVVRDGEKLWPPPPVQVSAAPAAAAKPVAAPVVAKEPRPAWVKLAAVGVGIVLLWLLSALAPAPIPEHITVLVLAIVIGYYVIGKVHHALHTPLMSVTNAISGIIVVGAMLQIGQHHDSGRTAIQIMSFVAILLASINIVGGFAVTRRMLAMFSREPAGRGDR